MTQRGAANGTSEMPVTSRSINIALVTLVIVAFGVAAMVTVRRQAVGDRSGR